LGNAGTVTIRASQAANGIYGSSSKDITLTIGKKPLTVTAEAKSKVYGAADPSLTYLATLEGADVLTGSLSRAAGTDVGTYAISSTLINSNYDITFVPANLTITKKALTVTAEAKSKVYGSSDPTLTYNATLEGADVLTGSLSRAAGTDVGTYAISSTLSNSNYDITFVPTNLSITKRAITITADEKSKVSGENDPEFTYQISSGSLVSGDTFSGKLTRNSGDSVGIYDILIGDLTLGGNYDLSFVSNRFNVSLVLTTGALRRSSKAVIIEGQISIEANVIERGVVYSSTNTDPQIGATNVIQLADTSVSGPFQMTITGLNSFTKYYFQTYIIVETPSGKIRIFTSNKSLASSELYGGAKDFTTLTEEPTLALTENTNPTTGTERVDPEINLEIGFNSAIQKGSGYILLKKASDDTLLETIDVSSANVAVTGQKVTITPTLELPQTTQVYVIVPVGAIEDLSGNGWTGFNDKTDWNFTSDDTVLPTIVAITPNHTSTNIAPHSNLEISFSEEIVKGTGNILVKDHLDNSTIATIVVTSTQVSVASNVVTINPTTDLPSETSFYVEIEGTAFKDSYDNNFSGVNTKDIWSFATADITAPNSPVIVEVADYTCSETTLATADNTFVITGTAENESTVNVFINDTNVGTVSTDSNGSWTLDLSSTVQIDGEYNITATATDSSNNTSNASDEFEIIVSTTNSDLDNIPDFCDSDAENDGYADATQITEKTKYGFSPNGDGINDTWTIRDIENFDNNSVKVFNRSGRLVYAKDNYDNTWDGTSSAAIGNGKLPVGAYYFTIDLKVDGVKMVSGWIYINY
ncbi:MBG domain-containing protein, partial [Flavicella sp.]|uniref:MBG domain-containing protein n=1 Tax=Flavicella sp. TaxID=2957742 RepID=UPI00261161A5